MQITITTCGKIFSREKMLADLAVFLEISQIKRMIRQIDFSRKNTFVTRKIESCLKKNFHQSQNYSLLENTFQ